MKTIFRSTLSREFVTVPNALAQDKRLSFRARGLLIMVLSLPSDWEVHKGWLLGETEGQCKEGREAISHALDELLALGYAKYEKQKNESGQFACNLWMFSDTTKYAPCTASRQRLAVNGEPTATKDTQDKSHKKKSGQELPANLQTPAFLQCWERWKRFRVELRKPLTETSAVEQLCLLSQMGPERATECLSASIRNGWQGIFPDKIPQQRAADPKIIELKKNEAEYDRLLREAEAKEQAKWEAQKKA